MEAIFLALLPPLQCGGDSFGGYRGRSAGLAVLPGTPWLESGAWSHSSCTRGRRVQWEIYLYNIYFINLLDVHQVL